MHLDACDLVEVDRRARRAWPFLPEYATAGSVWEHPAGGYVRVNDDGSADEVGEIPRRWSSAADPCVGPTPDIRKNDICQRCGGPLPSLVELAAVAMRADVALRNRTLAVPDVATNGLHAVAAALRCHAALCGGATPTIAP